jgi:transcriptional regulator with GAF, ATPase, and Fis domain
MKPIPDEAELHRALRERDLYLRLLDVGSKTELEPFVREALEIVTEVVGAHQGYLELIDERDSSSEPHWWAAHGFSAAEIDAVRTALSRGIIAEAVQTGETIVTGSALNDARFDTRQSVRGVRIEAVICTPIGQSPPLGVLYLQRRVQPGPFSDEDREKIERFARHIVPYAERLLARHRSADAADATRELRARLRLGEVIGRSEALAGVLRDVALVAPLDVDVLLTGQSGTGKSQIARIIHENSTRAGRPFVELNCAAIPEPLMESELFGAAAGAHSTATRRVEGKVAVAERGTLFLDEIGELSPSAQAKLLQLLQSRIYYPLGSSRAVHADLRILAATNADLQSLVSEGRFREDLYYRLTVLPIRVPSLAERRADIAELACHFCAVATERHHLPRVTLSEELLRALETAEWPGNIRQLAHAIEAAAIRAAGLGMQQVERSQMFPDLGADARPRELASSGVAAPVPPDAAGGAAAAVAPAKAQERLTFQEATRRFQARLLRETFEETGWNIVEASRRLELTRSHVYTLIRAFGIERGQR